MKSYIEKPSDVKRDWYLIDAKNKTLGRISTQIATLLRGKHKAIFTPFVDTGDYVVVINAEKVTVTGNKAEQKTYVRHTGYPGGIRERTFKEQQARKPEEIIRHAVKGMLPKGKLGRTMLKKLRVYIGEEHDNKAQKPVPYEV